MRAAHYASYLQPKKRGSRERMGASRQLTFEWKTLIWIGRHCMQYNRHFLMWWQNQNKHYISGFDCKTSNYIYILEIPWTALPVLEILQNRIILYQSFEKSCFSSPRISLCVEDHNSKTKALIKKVKTCGPSPWSTLANGMSYSWVQSISIKKPCYKQRSSLSLFCFI